MQTLVCSTDNTSNIRMVLTNKSKNKPVEFWCGDVKVTIFPRRKITICEITLECGTLMAYGLGVRKHGDAYDRELGCRMALKSAIENGKDRETLNRSDAADLWAEYFKIFPISERNQPEPAEPSFPKGVLMVYGI